MTSLCRWVGFVDTCVYLVVMLKLIPTDHTRFKLQSAPTAVVPEGSGRCGLPLMNRTTLEKHDTTRLTCTDTHTHIHFSRCSLLWPPSEYRAVPCRAEPCVVMRALVGLTGAHVLSAHSH